MHRLLPLLASRASFTNTFIGQLTTLLLAGNSLRIKHFSVQHWHILGMEAFKVLSLHIGFPKDAN